MKKIMLMIGVIMTCLYMESCSKVQNNSPYGENISNDIVMEWNEIAYEAFGGKAYLNSLMASRINAMTHIAMHDALNAVYPAYETYVFNERNPDADPVAAAVSAAYTVLVHEIPERIAFLDSSLQTSLSAIAEGEAKSAGIRLGKNAGQAIIHSRSGDGSSENPISAIPQSDVPGTYQVVPPFDFVFAPFWKDMSPFGMQKTDQFRSKAHPSIESPEYTEAFDEVKELGRLTSTIRSNDQNECANFWYEFSEAGWNRMARIAAETRNLNLFETARLFALVDMAMADAYIAGWDSKFHYNLWRPYTAIHNAQQDNNNYTEADLQWEPAMPTPPVQDYPSTHSALGNAAATVLASILGDETAFTMYSPTAIAGKSRSFTGFKQAADENADSRVLAGIHFRFACEAGQEMGDKIGEWIVDNYLKPLK
jgi:hypothetical protein